MDILKINATVLPFVSTTEVWGPGWHGGAGALRGVNQKIFFAPKQFT